MSNILDFSLFKSKKVDHEVAGQTLGFYPISLPMLRKLRPLIGPLVQAASSLVSHNLNKCVTTTIQEGTDPETGEKSRIIHEEAMKPEMVEAREKQRARTVEKAIETLLEGKNFTMIAELLMDSLRDKCPRKPSAEQIEAFADNLDIALIGEMLAGWWKASAAVFGAAGERVAAMVKAHAKVAVGSQEPEAEPQA